MAHTGIADPDDFGNKPGEGPLRAGGESQASLPSSEQNRPDTLSPRAAAQRHALSIVRDLWAGGEAVRGAGHTYLPKAPGEDPDDYGVRLARSLFFNAFRQTVVGLVGLIFRKDPVLGDDVPAPTVEHWENIDLAGTHGDVFLKQIAEDAMTAGHAAILVDFPVVPEVIDQEAEMEVRPYWIPIRKEQILSWRTGNVDGVTVLAQVVIQTDAWVPVGDFGEELLTEYLVITRDLDFDPDAADAAPVTWKLLQVAEKIVVEIDKGTYENQDEIPLAEIITSGHVSMFVSDPPLADLGATNIAHYQMWSDYATGIHKTNVPLLALSGVDNRDDQGNPVAVVVGANTVLTFRDPQAKAEYVSHDGAALDSTKKALDDLKSDMGVLGIAMLAPQKRAAETAEAKRLDKSTSDSALGVTARGLQDGAERALHFHARYLMNQPEGGSITINRDFEGLLMDAPVMQAYATLRGVGFPARIILKALQDGGRVPEDEDLDALELEMEANAIAEEEQATIEREARLAQMNEEQGGAA